MGARAHRGGAEEGGAVTEDVKAWLEKQPLARQETAALVPLFNAGAGFFPREEDV